MIDEEMLAAGLRDLAEQEDTGAAPVSGLLRRGHRARLGRAARTAAVAVTACAMIAGGFAFAPAGQEGTGSARPVPGTGSARPVPLALAAQETKKTTFHARLERHRGPDAPSRDPAGTSSPALAGPPSRVLEGWYDPDHDRWYWRGSRLGGMAFAEVWKVGQDCFVRSAAKGGPWARTRARCSPLGDGTPEPESARLGESADPGQLLVELESAGQVNYAGRTGKGRDAVDAYEFTYTADYLGRPVIKTGTVEIQVVTRRIVRVSYEVQPPGAPGPNPVRIDLRLDDFGIRADANLPASPLPPLASPTR